MQKVDLIIHGTLVPMTGQTVIPDGAIVIHEGVIVDCGIRAGFIHQYTATRTIDAANKLILPGFINGHTHAGMTLLRGVTDTAVTVHEWLNYILPLEKKLLSDDFVYYSTLLACYEMIQSGITTFADMYYREGASARAVQVAGMRAILGETIFTLPATLKSIFVSTERITYAIAPHSLYSCDEHTLKTTYAYAQEHDLAYLIHVAEHGKEIEDLFERTGMSPGEYMHSLGILSARTIIAHGVHFSDTDLNILAQAGASIIYNPTSNMKLRSGVARVKKMQDTGIAVGIGTDGAASNNALDMMAELKTGALLQDLGTATYHKPLSPFEMVQLATSSGAHAVGLQGKIGTLEIGKRADIIIIDIDHMHQLPVHDIFSTLVYSSKSTDVETVIIDGELIMHNRKMLTLEPHLAELRDKIHEYQTKIRKSSL